MLTSEGGASELVGMDAPWGWTCWGPGSRVRASLEFIWCLPDPWVLVLSESLPREWGAQLQPGPCRVRLPRTLGCALHCLNVEL